MPKLNTARFALSAAATHGALYAVGGFNGEQYMSSVAVLDPRVGRYCFTFCCKCYKQNPFWVDTVLQQGWTHQQAGLPMATRGTSCIVSTGAACRHAEPVHHSSLRLLLLEGLAAMGVCM